MIMEIMKTELKNKLNMVKIAVIEVIQKTTGMSIHTFNILNIINRPFSDSIVIQIGYGKSYKKIIMKTPVHHPVNETVLKKENQALVEFNILSKLYPYFKEIKGCSVPEPILVLPDIETYVMGFVDGEMLVDKLILENYFTSRKGFERLSRELFNCGKWLKKFQECTGLYRAGPDILDDVIGRCEQQLTLIKESGNTDCPDNLKNEVLNFVRYQQSLITNSEVLVSGRHGDFGAWNIIASDDGITVIDYLGFQNEPVEVDLLKMLSNLNNDEKSLRSSRTRIMLLRKMFLDGYGDIMNYSEPVQKICEAYHRTASLESAVNDKAFRFHRLLEKRRRINDNLNWLLYDCGDKTRLLSEKII
jgi:hypothetical protein